MAVIGIDVGGTFTDLHAEEDGRTCVIKVPSTPQAPARAVVAALEKAGEAGFLGPVIHGTTVALNALLEGRTHRVAFVTGEGFRDLIEIGRQDRDDIYALHPSKTLPLVPRRLRFEVPARIWPREDGPGFLEIHRPSRTELASLKKKLEAARVEAVAVCLLHSWADPRMEEQIGRSLAGLKLPVTLSGRLLPEHREFERFSTAIVNAGLAPLMASYVASLTARFGGRSLRLLQSSGESISVERAAREPARILLSGPAGGVVGARMAAREAGFEQMVGLDMGGTSTDVSFHEGSRDGAPQPWSGQRTPGPVRIGGHPIGLPSLDIHTIGCGGGSIATVDSAGALHVGPLSAGADPGPVCHGRGSRPTVTDAHVLLGHIRSDRFLGGNDALVIDRVERAYRDLARSLGASPEEAAIGVIEAARASMKRAIGVMTMQRGHDPEALPLVAFGGAGGLHAAALAESMNMPAALIPASPGALSAMGMARSTPGHECARGCMQPLSAWPQSRLRGEFANLEREARAVLAADGALPSRVQISKRLDLRYRGQSFELTIPWSPRVAESFHRVHARLYGYALESVPIELVCIRAVAFIPATGSLGKRPRRRQLPGRAIRDHRRVVFDRARRTAVLDRSSLQPGHSLLGPAVIEEYTATTLLPRGWRIDVTHGSHLLMVRI